MKKILLDTNAYSALMCSDQFVLKTIESADQVFMSPICLGELYAGFRLGSKERENRSILQKFLSQPTVRLVPVTAQTAEWFSTIFAQLKHQGTPIPLNDVWIAAQTQENGAELLTFDAHFRTVSGLLLLQQH